MPEQLSRGQRVQHVRSKRVGTILSASFQTSEPGFWVRWPRTSRRIVTSIQAKYLRTFYTAPASSTTGTLTRADCPVCGAVVIYSGNYFCSNENINIGHASYPLCDWALPHPVMSPKDQTVCDQLGIGYE